MKRILIALLAVSLCGCSWHARKLLKIEEKISERVKENVQIADEALDAQPVEHKTRQTDIASQAVHDAAVLSGYPLEDQRPFVAGLLSANEKLRKGAEDAWAAKRKSDQKLRTVQMHQLRELQNLGAEQEAARNQNIVSKAWHWAIATFGIGGIIALCVFFPFLVPIIGRLCGWIVSKIPALAGFFGVVATKAYDAVVRGVETAKNKNSAVKVVVEDELSKKMDTADKNLVLERKVAIADKDLATAQKKAAVKEKVAKTVEETATVEKGKPDAR